MIKPNSKFRPNPSRAIYIEGALDDKKLSLLTPQILKLHSQSREPISTYVIDSPGGQVQVMRSLLSLLRQGDQDGASPCRLITVVISKAQSAAADLVSAGDYAIAYPDSNLLFHGVRTPGITAAFQPLTAERTSLLAHFLRLSNDAFAMELVRKTEYRFLLRFVLLRAGFQKYRQEIAPGIVSDIDCFLALLKKRLSSNAVEVLERAQKRYALYEPLLSKLRDEENHHGGPVRHAELEANQIKAIVDFEVENNRNDASWSFKDKGGLARVVEDFFLMSEYIEIEKSERRKEWALSIGKMSLSDAERQELDRIPDEKERNEKFIERVLPATKPVLTFFVALCHSLQEQENELTATDAYWFGLIDEVWGNSSLVCKRQFEEYEEDPAPEPPPAQPPEPPPAQPPEPSPAPEVPNPQNDLPDGRAG